MRLNEERREYKTLICTGITHIEQSTTRVVNLGSSAIPKINACMDSRFQSFHADIFNHIYWIDPANWNDTEREVKSLQVLRLHCSLQDLQIRKLRPNGEI